MGKYSVYFISKVEVEDNDVNIGEIGKIISPDRYNDEEREEILNLVRQAIQKKHNKPDVQYARIIKDSDSPAIDLEKEDKQIEELMSSYEGIYAAAYAWIENNTSELGFYLENLDDAIQKCIDSITAMGYDTAPYGEEVCKHIVKTAIGCFLSTAE